MSEPAHPWSTALVTGASAGIGLALAEQLAASGTDLVLVARRAHRLTALAARLRRHGVKVEVLAVDLLDADERARVAERLASSEQPIDLLVNSAGLGLAGPFAEGELDTYHRIVELNVTTVVDLAHAALGPMLERDRGWILNVSSLGGHAPGPQFAVYSASKAFVTSFSESLVEEVRGTGVHVTVVCPGATATEFGAIAGTKGGELPELLRQSADEVAAEALRATAAGRAVQVTGTINRISAALTTVLPRSANRRISAMVTDQL